MHEDEHGGGYLEPAVSGPPGPDGDPVAAVMAVSEPRDAAERVHGEPGTHTPRSEGELNAATGGNDYEDFQWPDGYAADPAALARFIPLARELGLPRESAQKLAHLYAELDGEKRRSQAEFVARNNAQWLREIHEHPEFGGANLRHSADAVAGAMRRFGTPLLAAQVRQMNIQNWPEMFFFLARISRSVTEDCSPANGGSDAPAKSTAQLLFPGLK